MIDEQVCLQKLHRILSEYSDDQNIKNLSIIGYLSGLMGH